ncbi:hypothetical protein [Aneurinibacillus tyrosinisolvens]|uniref:hypothetical protein n=1 Tax=Aneurinibacillus tyrosinisolvens TaxID=1443435 RepID=UPI00063EFDCE|nr:hypothetical protein [Aneurinibacillus tyrosinisolvens]
MDKETTQRDAKEIDLEKEDGILFIKPDQAYLIDESDPKKGITLSFNAFEGGLKDAVAVVRGDIGEGKNLVQWLGKAHQLASMVIEESKSKEDNALSEDDLPPKITLKDIKDIIAENEVITGKTLKQFKQAIDQGEIVNYSLIDLDMWEMYEEMKREMEED